MKNLNTPSGLTRFFSLRVGLVALILMIGAGFTLAAAWDGFGLFGSVKASAESSHKAAALMNNTSGAQQEASFTINTCDTGMAVEVEANATSTGYATLGAAFTAINAGTHTGAINIEICQSTNEGATPATLNSGDAAPANFTTVNIYPLVDGLTITGAPVTGFGVIQLNGSDSVTIDGDNPNSAGTNRNLTVSNTATNTIIANSAIRIAVSAAVLSANNDTIKNLVLLGNVTSGNAAAITSTAGSSNSSFGIYVGGNGGATAVGAPTAITSVTANTAPSGTTVNNLTIDNNTVNQCARAIVFNGAVATVSTGVTVSNNVIGDQGAATPATPPYTAPATTVYTKGIWVAGTAAVTISGNTLKNIISYVGTTMTAIELPSPVTASTISNNTINTVANNGTVSIVKAVLVTSTTGTYSIAGNTITNVQALAGASGTDGLEVVSASTGGTIERNKIQTVYNRNTGTFGAFGLNLTAGTGILIKNNFISDINMDMTGGGAFSTTFGVHGIRIAGGTNHKIYHNSVNLFGTLLGTATTSILTSAFTPTATTITGLEVKNNIFSNTLTGGTTSIAHVSIFLPSSATSAMNLTINNNDYFANTTAGSAGIAHVGTTYTAVPAGPTTYAGLYTAANFNPADTASTTNLRTYTNTLSAAGTNDNASKVVDPQFLSNTDLHIAVASPMVDMGMSGLGVLNDIDSQLRVGVPDIGADEPSGLTPPANDIAAAALVNPPNGGTLGAGATFTPQASFTNVGTATQTNVPVRFKIIDASNNVVYNMTATIPSIAPNATVTVSFPSTSLPTPGTYTIMAASELVGDQTPANDSIMGTITVLAPITGAVNVGTGQTFTSLTNPGGIFAALNAAGASSNVTINITSDLSGETGSVALNELAGGFTVLIKPSGAARSITSTNTAVAVIKLNDADNVTLDGSLSGGTDRSLTITNTNPAASTTVIWVASNTNGAQNNIVKNTNLAGGVDQSVTNVFNFAIISSSSASILTGGSLNNNDTYTNNFIKKVSVGIISIGGLAASPNQNTTISNNLIGPAAFGVDEVSTLGVLIFNENAPNIVGNEFRFIGDAATTGGSSGRDHVGISLCTGNASWSGTTAPTVVGTVTNANVSRNLIHDIVERATFSAAGIVENCTNAANPTNNTIANNMIYNILANGTSGDQTVGIGISNGNGDKVVHNSVYLTGDIDPGTAASSSFSSFGISVAFATATNLTMKDDISGIDLSSNTATLLHAAINIPSPTYAWGTGGSDFNDWYAPAANAQSRVGATGGSGGTFYATLAAWQTAVAQDANSKSVDPLFVSATDLHLQLTSPLVNMGMAVAGVTNDFDNQTRDAMPDIGADELVAGTLALSSATYSVGEAAGSVTITVNRTGGTNGAVAVNYSLTNGTATGGAACGAGVDFVNTGGTVNFADGQASQTFMVPICNDAVFEGNETFNVMLSGATGGATIGAQASAVVTIVDDEVAMPGTVQFSAPTYTVAENVGGGLATITVTRTGGSDGAVSVDYATVAGGTATGGASCGAGVDYVNASGTLNWTNGDSAPKTFTITICNDTTNEASETVNLALSNATGGATIGAQGTAVLTITDDDTVPSISINDVSQFEGNVGTTNFTFNVTLSAASGQSVTVHYQTADGTATAPSDYTAILDTPLTFMPGQTSLPVTVSVIGDTNFEANETFFVNLSNPTNATILDNQGQGTIQNDDAVPGTVSINDVRTVEGNSGSHTVTFTATLTTNTQPPANASVQYATGGGTATPGPTPPADYQPASGTLFFGAADDSVGGTDGNPIITTRTFTVTIFGDTNKEANETFFVTLSNPVGVTIADGTGVGIIVDDDSARISNFDGDFNSDLAVFRPSNSFGDDPNDSFWYVLQSTNGLTKYEHFGSNGDLVVPGDYDGDTKTDYAVFRPSNGTWYIENSSDFTFRAQAWGVNTDLRVQADYDGDGKTDIAVWRPSTGTWYVLRSSNNSLQAVPFGANGDRPVQGDYDGDAKVDFAVFRPSTGTWYVLQSRDGSVVSTNWGNANDKTVVGDFDGDGKADFTVFRPSNGTWYILQSLTGAIRTQAWGTSGDIPVPADYDGDGTLDVAVFRPSTGDWHILKSADVLSRPDAVDYVPEQRHFGQNGDNAVPDGYHP
ncbi:MAG TPA: Calx-beta domain-containing protein [Pyrinomonadaceae bacterium]